KGAHVQSGVTLGSVGATPTRATGLDFHLRIAGDAVDPLQLVKKREPGSIARRGSGKGTYVPTHPTDSVVDFDARGRIRDHRRGVEQSDGARGHVSSTAHLC